MVNQERIICSAIWYDDKIKRNHQPRNIDSGIVAAGLRHHNCFVILWALYPERDYVGSDTVQGFLTSKDRFVDRKEAFLIAEANNQILEEQREKFPHRNELYSEHLY